MEILDPGAEGMLIGGKSVTATEIELENWFKPLRVLAHAGPAWQSNARDDDNLHVRMITIRQENVPHRLPTGHPLLRARQSGIVGASHEKEIAIVGQVGMFLTKGTSEFLERVTRLIPDVSPVQLLEMARNAVPHESYRFLITACAVVVAREQKFEIAEMR